MKNLLKKLYIRIVFLRNFGKTFSAHVVARWGVFRDIWGTLGGPPEGKNVPPKLDIPKVFFRNFWENFSARYGPIGAFRDIWGPLGDASGPGEETFAREKFPPQIIHPKSIFPEFRIFFVLLPDGGIYGYLGALGGR